MDGLSESRPAITRDDLDAGMLFQPGGQGRTVAAVQEIEHATPLQVDHDGAVPLALADGPVIDADEPRWRHWFIGSSLHATQEGVGARRQVELLRETTARLSAEGEADRSVGAG